MSKISIEGKPVYQSTGFPPLPVGGHLYLVYQNDIGEEFVLRGGPKNADEPFGALIVSPIELIADSLDRRIDNGFAVTPEDRGNITLPLGGRSAEDVWNLMIQYKDYILDQQLPYDPINGFNSNTVIANLLYLVGIDVNQVLPDFHGITIGGIFDKEYTGKDIEFNFDYTINGTNHNDLIKGRGGDQTFNGGGGNDTLEGGQGNDTYIYTSGDGFDTKAVCRLY